METTDTLGNWVSWAMAPSLESHQSTTMHLHGRMKKPTEVIITVTLRILNLSKSSRKTRRWRLGSKWPQLKHPRRWRAPWAASLLNPKLNWSNRRMSSSTRPCRAAGNVTPWIPSRKTQSKASTSVRAPRVTGKIPLLSSPTLISKTRSWRHRSHPLRLNEELRRTSWM